MKFIKYWLAPKQCYSLAGKCIPWAFVIFLGLFLYGSISGLFFTPPDYQQKDAFRIIYIHVPSAILSLTIYSMLFTHSVIYLIWRIKVADIIAMSSASLGASYTIIALVTGAIWGKPMWGTWWVWDARLTSELILLFLYIGYMGLRSSISNRDKAARICAIVSIVGMVDIPIIHFSVEWWTTLHQKATLTKFARPSIDLQMLYPLLAMIGAFAFFYITIVLIRMRSEILKMERHTLWVKNTVLTHGFV